VYKLWLGLFSQKDGVSCSFFRRTWGGTYVFEGQPVRSAFFLAVLVFVLPESLLTVSRKAVN